MIDYMLIGPVILDDRMTGQNHLDFLQIELPKQLEDVPFVVRYDRLHVDWSRYFRQSYERTKLPRLSAK